MQCRGPPARARPWQRPRTPPLLLPLLLLAAVAAPLPQRAASEAAPDCAALLQQYEAWNKKAAVPYGGDNMVYFLHVPRTAGRTFHTCLLKQGTPPNKRCPKSYDHLRIDFELPACKLLSSHDDFSVVQQLPEGTSVVTQIREPLDRFLSAYEFAIEVATRQVQKPRPRKPRGGRTLTDEVWPWSHLVPFFVEDIRARLDVLLAEKDPLGHWVRYETDEGRPYYYNKVINESKWELDGAQRARLVPPLDAYSNRLVMPLAEFARHPIAKDLLHNGEAFQVLGLTNYSHWPQANTLRACAMDDRGLQQKLLDIALRRLRTFSHVGTTDRLGPSAESCAASLGLPLDGPAYTNTAENRRADVENPNRALKYADAMARGDEPREVPAWRRIREEGEQGKQAAAPGQQQQQQQQPAGGPDHAPDHGSDHRPDRKDGSGGHEYDDSQGEDGEGGADADKEELRDIRDDIHSLAGDVRAAKERLDAAEKRWNDAVDRLVPQEELRPLRQDLTRARLELSEAQTLLLEVRKEEEAVNSRRLAEDKRKDAKLGLEFWRCANRAQARNKGRKKNSMAGLAMPHDGRTIDFSRAARDAIPAEVKEEITRGSWMDSELHTLASQLLTQKRQILEHAGLLQALPPKPEEKPPKPAPKRRLQGDKPPLGANGGEGAGESGGGAGGAAVQVSWRPQDEL